VAYMGTASQEGPFGIVWAASAHAGRQPDVRGLEVSSFAFMHSNQQRCKRDRTIFVMGDSNFEAATVRWSGTPRNAAVDSEVPSGVT
jgi:hypothetical protein